VVTLVEVCAIRFALISLCGTCTCFSTQTMYFCSCSWLLTSHSSSHHCGFQPVGRSIGNFQSNVSK